MERQRKTREAYTGLLQASGKEDTWKFEGSNEGHLRERLRLMSQPGSNTCSWHVLCAHTPPEAGQAATAWVRTQGLNISVLPICLPLSRLPFPNRKNVLEQPLGKEFSNMLVLSGVKEEKSVKSRTSNTEDVRLGIRGE